MEKSKKPSKQRFRLNNTPLHLKGRLLSSMLSKELKQTHKKGSVVVRKGDTVKIMRGQDKGKSGLVERVLRNEAKIIVAGISYNKKDGSKIMKKIHASNVMITQLYSNDKKRMSKLTK